MKEIIVKRNWWLFYFFCITLGGITLFTIIDSSKKIIHSWPGDLGNWGELIMFIVIFILTVIYFFWKIFLVQLLIKFTDEYIKIPTLTKALILPWKDIQSVKLGYDIIELTGKQGSVKLSAHLFQNPEEVFALIKSHVPANLIP
jgi:hypothetical protein